MKFMFVFLLSCLLAACGGGSTVSPTPSTPPIPRTDLRFGYFQTGSGQLDATAASVNVVHCQDDSNPDDPAARAWRETQIIECLQSAQMHGLNTAIVSIGFLLFDGKFKYRGIGYLVPFYQRLVELGLTDMVQWLYILDEPDVHGVDDATMTQAISDATAVWQGPKVAVVYGATGNTPGIGAANMVGRDAYSIGTGVFNELPPIRVDQRWVIVPGGADPWRQDPQPFYTYANATPQVAMIWAFLFSDYVDLNGAIQVGIGKNGMLPAYTAVGAQIKNAFK